MKYLIFITLLLASLTGKAQVTDSLDKELLHAELTFWQAKTDSSRFTALLNKVQLYRHAAFYNLAIKEAYRADTYAFTKPQQAQLKYEKMIASFLTDDYRYCSGIVFDSSELGNHAKQIEFMTLASLNESENWHDCKTAMLKYLPNEDSMKRKEIAAMRDSFNYKDPYKCRHLSAYLPGLGETYAGYPFKGITSFVLNAGFLVFTGFNIYTAYYFTAVTSGVFPFFKFYKGGKRLSENLAERHNIAESNKLKSQFNKEINSILN